MDHTVWSGVEEWFLEILNYMVLVLCYLRDSYETSNRKTHKRYYTAVSSFQLTKLICKWIFSEVDNYILFFRLVYKWFYLIYKISYGLGLVGYVIMMCTFFGLHVVFGAKPQTWMDGAILFVFYGLYYGVVGQDLAVICSEKMASHIGVRKYWIFFF